MHHLNPLFTRISQLKGKPSYTVPCIDKLKILQHLYYINAFDGKNLIKILRKISACKNNGLGMHNFQPFKKNPGRIRPEPAGCRTPPSRPIPDVALRNDSVTPRQRTGWIRHLHGSSMRIKGFNSNFARSNPICKIYRSYPSFPRSLLEQLHRIYK